MSVPKRVADRIERVVKQYHDVIQQQRARDVSEADTVTLVKDLMSDLFGFDKYAELTSEHSIRGTYCDLAVKIDDKLVLLIEVKAIGLDLKDTHVRQAIDYAANQGCEWVVLTNAVEWRLYHVLFKKPIDKEEVSSIDLLQCSAKRDADCERLYLLTREGFSKNALADFRARMDATSRYMLAAIVLHSESVRSAIRREVRRASELLVDEEVIERMLRDEVIKRESIEGEQAEAAARRVQRSSERSIHKPSDRVPAVPTAAPAPRTTS